MAGNEVIPADTQMGNAYMVVKIVGELAAFVLTVRVLQQMQAGAPPGAVFWDRVRAMSQRAALQLGTLGLYAESRYQEMMK